MMNMGLPQAGIITSLDAVSGQAKVFLPLYKIETALIPVSTNLLYETQAALQQVTINAPAAQAVAATSGSVDAPPTCPGRFGTWEAEEMSAARVSAPSGLISRITYGTLKVGDEVVVVFLNGDINQGRVIARF